jgi:polyhydroxyalkanoate synthesis repressor PhaR
MPATHPRVIKRYANRKLYDTRDSRYVTLDQIAAMIRKGEDVKVVDNSSKEDLTSVTLAQIIFEEEKRQRSFLPLFALRRIIQSGGESLHDLMNQISGTTGRLFHRHEGEGEAAAASDAAEGQPTDPSRMLREFIESVQHTIDTWQKRLDANVHNAIESVSPFAPMQKEIQGLRERISDLEQKLARVESPPSTPPAS